jgi:hypothetical protein
MCALLDSEPHTYDGVSNVPDLGIGNRLRHRRWLEPQKRLVSCIAEASTGLFPAISDSQEPMTFVILEHRKFLATRAAFHSYRTRLAFSNLAIRRIYLSSRVLADRNTALWVIDMNWGIL